MKRKIIVILQMALLIATIYSLTVPANDTYNNTIIVDEKGLNFKQACSDHIEKNLTFKNQIILLNEPQSWRIRTLGWNYINEAGTAVKIEGSLGILFSMGLYDVGFAWGTSYNVNNKVEADDYGFLNTFSSNIYNLNRKTNFYYMAIGQHKNTGIMYEGFLRSFKLGQISIGTQDATNIHQNSATLHGQLYHMGGAPNCQVWFQYGISPDNLNRKTAIKERTSIGPFSESLTGLYSEKKYYFQAVGLNDCGTVYCMTYNFTTSEKSDNNPPFKPFQPSGPTDTISNVTYNYSTSTVDPEDDTLRYGWDWNGDDNVDEWTDFFTSGERINTSHVWTDAGTSIIKVIAEDEEGAQSDYSDPLEVVTTNNQPPNNPISDYNRLKDELFIRTSDPNEDQIRYGISWDNDNTVDGWTDFVDSGVDQRVDCKKRDGTVGIIAEDEYGAQSDWVSIKSKNKPINIPYLNLLKNHPYIFPILRQLMEPYDLGGRKL